MAGGQSRKIVRSEAAGKSGDRDVTPSRPGGMLLVRVSPSSSVWAGLRLTLAKVGLTLRSRDLGARGNDENLSILCGVLVSNIHFHRIYCSLLGCVKV